jgi:diguanylate cyclase (GGDEF)-like protein
MDKTPRVRGAGRWWSGVHPLSSVRGRIIVGFGFLVLILVGVAAGSAWQVREHRSRTAAMERHADTAFLLKDVHVHAEAGAADLQRYVLVGNESLVGGEETLIPEIRSDMAAAVESLTQALTDTEMRGEREQAARLHQLSAEADSLVAGVELIFSLRESGDVEAAVAAQETAVVPFREFEEELEAAAETELQEVSTLRSQADRAGDLALWLLIISGAGGALLGLVASVVIGRSIIKPLSSLEATAVAVSKGDPDARAQASGPRELAHLGLALNDMMNAMEERAQELRLTNEELLDRHRQLMDARAQAATDQLTGVLNHRTFHERIRDAVTQAETSGESVGLIMLDIDDFKGFNDSLGHQAGDEALRGVALSIAQVVKKEDTYRYGGDEFAVLLPGADSRKTVQVAEQVRRAVAAVPACSGKNITVSLGIAEFPRMAQSAEELLYRADMAMYWAKSTGKNRVGDWDGLLSRRTGDIVPGYVSRRGAEAQDTIAALVASLRAKNSITGVHSERCSWYVARLAQELDFSEEEASALRLAALLHDIGKLTVPDDVLSKPGPLNEEEWAQMRQHPTTAAHILSGIAAIDDAKPAIHHHHEHFDGSGYPDGLAGEEIPLASRILLVADAFDAMTTDRPYRRGMPIEAAVEELKRHSGRQFDPVVVEAFVRMIRRDGGHPLQSAAAHEVS